MNDTTKFIKRHLLQCLRNKVDWGERQLILNTYFKMLDASSQIQLLNSGFKKFSHLIYEDSLKPATSFVML